MSMELALKHARKSLRWALVSSILTTGIPILYFFSTASRWVFVGAMAYTILTWVTYFVQRRAHRAAYGE